MLRLLSYESDTGLILLLEGDAAVLVDVTLCVDRWIREHLSVIMVVGYVEACSVSDETDAMRCIDHHLLQEQLPIPTMPRYARAPAVDASLVIRAGLVVPVPDLDTDEWHQAVDDREAVIKWS